MVKDYVRKITHSNYKNPEKLKKYYHGIKKKIHKKPKIYKETKYSKSDYLLRNQHFIVTKAAPMATTEIYGGISIILFFGVLWYGYKDGFANEHIFFLILSSFLTLFFIFYAVTMPKKEHILNRRDGLVTMTGFMWQKNITMSFDKVEFAYSTGGENGIGGFMLQTIRPNKWQTFD
ncbi:hypothetical protein OAT18_00005, partial [Tenacibaculum sp.]|nr:hypothetical protein [Tenacibaculum sp.]